MEIEKKKRGSNTTEKQKQMLCEFVKKRPRLISGKQTHQYTQKDAAGDWQEVADLLNSMPGAHKNWREWRKCWQDLRSRTKTKRARNCQHAQRTGGGPRLEDPLRNTKQDVLQIIKTVSVEGYDALESRVDNFIEDPEGALVYETEDDDSTAHFPYLSAPGHILDESIETPTPATKSTIPPERRRGADEAEAPPAEKKKQKSPPNGCLKN